jgi:hypothetical protein
MRRSVLRTSTFMVTRRGDIREFSFAFPHLLTRELQLKSRTAGKIIFHVFNLPVGEGREFRYAVL